MTELATDLEPLAPLRCKPQVWALYWRDVDLAVATASFRVKFGYEPLSHRRDGGGLHLERRPDADLEA